MRYLPASLKFLLVVILIPWLSACGGGGGDDNENFGTAPLISGFSISPSAVYVNHDGGQTDVYGNFKFIDPDGNLNSMTLTVLDTSGQTVMSETIPITGVSGLTSGTIQGKVTAPTSTPDYFTVQIYVTDISGLRSNTLELIFSVSEMAWVPKSAMPTSRLNFSSATVNGLIYIIGGQEATSPITPKPVLSTVEIYDPATDTWSTGPSLPNAAANQMTITANGKIYAIGGGLQFGETNAVQEFDLETQIWTLKANMPDERTMAAISVNNGLIYIIGGRRQGSELDSLLWYDPVSDTWGYGSSMSIPREGLEAATIDEQILVYGGYGIYGDYGGFFTSLESYDPIMDSWSSRANGYPRRNCRVAVFDNLMYVFGGASVERSLDRVDAYDSAINQWKQKTPMPSKLGFARAETIGGKIYVFDTNITFEYTPSNDIR